MFPRKPSNKPPSASFITEVTPQKVENEIIESKKEYSRKCKITHTIQHITNIERQYIPVCPGQSW